jgi:hypothetical protein
MLHNFYRNLLFVALALGFAVATPADGVAQVKVQTQTITSSPPAAAQTSPPAASGPPTPITGAVTAAKPAGAAKSDPPAPPPEFILDIARLPEPVARMREKILAAARSGDLNQVAALMHAGSTVPIFSLNDDKEPIPFWQANYPDSNGVEVLSILIQILESGVVHVDKGTPQDMYVWPYFARMPLDGLNPAQKVQLFKIITGTDYKDMLDFGAYNFYRLGISPDGTWQFFVAGD